jgi:hypothetical protein
MINKEYEQLYNGDVIKVFFNEKILVACCDCGKVVEHQFRFNKESLLWKSRKHYGETKIYRATSTVTLSPFCDSKEDFKANDYVMISKKEYNKLLKGNRK